MPQIIIGPELKKLDGSLQKATYGFLAKLAADDSAPGLHIEPIKNSVDTRARTGRVGMSYRAVLFKLQGSRHDASYVFAGTYPHDEAIEVARTSRININPRNGVAELIPIDHSGFVAPAPPKVFVAPPAPQRAERSLREREYVLEDLTNLGLDERFSEDALDLVGAEAVLEYAENAPASWQGNVLLDLYTGESFASIRAKYTLEETVSLDQSNDDDVLKAMQHPAARMEFAFIEDNEELRLAIEDRPEFAAWRMESGSFSGLDSPGSDRRRGIIAAGVAFAVVVAAIVGTVVGWAMRGSDAESRSRLSPAVTSDPAGAAMAPAFTEEQARQRACDAYKAIGPEWTTAYQDWSPAVKRPGWRWSDPDVREASDRFRVVSNDVAARISVLMPVNTPADVRDAINGYTGAILIYESDLGWQARDILSAHERQIDEAAAAAEQACSKAPR